MLRSGEVIGLQHKNTNKLNVLTIDTLLSEAEAFEPALTSYLIMTTSKRDGGLQLAVRRRTAERIASKRFSVEVWFWEDIRDELAGHADLVEKYYSWGAPEVQRPRVGSERARAWVHQLLNPWLEAIDEELRILNRGSLTWRFHSRAPDRLGRLAEYLASSRTFEDFLRAHPANIEPLLKHDTLLETAVKCAQEACDELARSSEFTSVVFSKLQEHNQARERQDNPAGAFSVERLPELVAENLINNAVDRTGYSDFKFWGAYREVFRAMRTGVSFENLGTAVRDLAAYDEQLRELISAWHFDLCQRYGIAPEPGSGD